MSTSSSVILGLELELDEATDDDVSPQDPNALTTDLEIWTFLCKNVFGYEQLRPLQIKALEKMTDPS